MSFAQTFNCVADPRPARGSSISYVRREFQHYDMPICNSVRRETARRLNGIEDAYIAANRVTRIKSPTTLSNAFSLRDSLMSTTKYLGSPAHTDKMLKDIPSCSEPTRHISNPTCDNFEAISTLTYVAEKEPIFGSSLGISNDSAMIRSSMSHDSDIGMSSGHPISQFRRSLPYGVGDGSVYNSLSSAYSAAVSAADTTVGLCTTKDCLNALSRPGYARGRVLDDLIYM